jgi:hypothetical protein
MISSAKLSKTSVIIYLNLQYMTKIKMRIISCVTALIFFSTTIVKAQVKILFDASKAEASGNADWIIDADANNIGYFNGPAQIGGTESNPQRIPTPLQSTITSSTLESAWMGGISAWGIDCAKYGYIVESLPYNGLITYGVSTNAQDLSNYKIFVVCEPNILFTSSQKTAILQFVQNGGGLFIIGNHAGSDRNGDGEDSRIIWNDLMLNNSIQNNPFGFTYDSVNIVQVSTNIATLPTDTLLHGPYGNVNALEYNNGATMTITPLANSNVKGVIYKNGSSSTGNTNAMMVRSRFGLGKVAAIGDSSPIDDGTGDPNDLLYDGYIGGGLGNHKKLIMNTTFWLANNIITGIENNPTRDFNIFPNPFADELTVTLAENKTSAFEIVNSTGQTVFTFTIGENLSSTIDLSFLTPGIYLIRNKSSNGHYQKIIKK